MKYIFIIGAQRCGTSLLYKVLDRHPEIKMAKPARPEPKYFLENFSTKDPITLRKKYVNKYFKKLHPRTKFCGEKSTSYFESETACQRIRSCFPDCKILVILRDPVMRALSNYNFSCANGYEERDFEEAIKGDKVPTQSKNLGHTSVNPYAYMKRGKYIVYLKKIANIFPRDQIKLLILEQFINEESSTDQLFSWLGLNPINCEMLLAQKQNSAPNHSLQTEMQCLRELGHQYKQSIKALEENYMLNLKQWTNQPWYN